MCLGTNSSTCLDRLMARLLWAEPTPLSCKKSSFEPPVLDECAPKELQLFVWLGPHERFCLLDVPIYFTDMDKNML